MAIDDNELSADKVDDLKRLAKCYALIAGLGNVGGDVKREIKAKIAEGLWHVMYDSITPKKENEK